MLKRKNNLTTKEPFPLTVGKAQCVMPDYHTQTNIPTG